MWPEAATRRQHLAGQRPFATRRPRGGPGMADELQGKNDRHPRRQRGRRAGRARPSRARRVERAGAEVELLSLEAGEVQGFNHLDKADTFTVDKAVADADADDYDGLHAARRRRQPRHPARPTRTPSRSCATSSTPASRSASICHAPWTLVEADVRARAHAHLVAVAADRPAQRGRRPGSTRRSIVDQGLVSSRKPDDLPGLQREDRRGVRRGPPRQGSRARRNRRFDVS